MSKSAFGWFAGEVSAMQGSTGLADLHKDLPQARSKLNEFQVGHPCREAGASEFRYSPKLAQAVESTPWASAKEVNLLLEGGETEPD